MKTDLQAAYTLISDFKDGAITPGTEIPEEQIDLLQLLSKDLGVSAEGVSLEQLVHQVARADTHWNHCCMTATDNIYAARERGDAVTAEAVRATFLAQCPSAWYRDIVDSLG